MPLALIGGMKMFHRLAAPLAAAFLGCATLGASPQRTDEPSAAPYELRDLGETASNAVHEPHEINADLPLLPGADGIDPQDINQSGVVAGWVFSYSSGPRGGLRQRATRWRDRDVEPLAPELPGRGSAAFAINDVDEVAGWVQLNTADGRVLQRAAAWTAERSPRMLDLGALGGSDAHSVAYDINDARQIVGTSDTETGTRHAFLWDRGRMIDLGALAGETDSEAFAINERGEIAGTSLQRRCGTCLPRATLWRQGQMIDLNSLLPANSGWHLLEATELDDHGCIAGRGLLNGEPRYFMLSTHDGRR